MAKKLNAAYAMEDYAAAKQKEGPLEMEKWRGADDQVDQMSQALNRLRAITATSSRLWSVLKRLRQVYHSSGMDEQSVVAARLHIHV